MRLSGGSCPEMRERGCSRRRLVISCAVDRNTDYTPGVWIHLAAHKADRDGYWGSRSLDKLWTMTTLGFRWLFGPWRRISDLPILVSPFTEAFPPSRPRTR